MTDPSTHPQQILFFAVCGPDKRALLFERLAAWASRAPCDVEVRSRLMVPTFRNPDAS